MTALVSLLFITVIPTDSKITFFSPFINICKTGCLIMTFDGSRNDYDYIGKTAYSADVHPILKW